MRRCRQTCSCYPVPRRVAHRRAPRKSWSSHPLPALAPTLAPPASSQKHLPTPVGPTPSPSKKMSAVAKWPHLPPDPLSLAPAWPLPLPAHQTQLYLGCGSTWSRCGPSSSVRLSPLFTTAACTYPAPLPARSSARHPALTAQVPPACSPRPVHSLARCVWAPHRALPSHSSSYFCAHSCWDGYLVGRVPPRMTGVFISHVDRGPSFRLTEMSLHRPTDLLKASASLLAPSPTEGVSGISITF